MIAQSKVQDFYRKLEENVTADKLIWVFSPKRYNGKEFSGTYDKRSFSIHLNSAFSTYRMHNAKGSYKKKGNIYDVEYEIVRSLKLKYFVLILLVFLLIINIIQFYEKLDSDIILVNNLILIGFSCFLLALDFLINRMVKKDLKKKFEEIFEINPLI